MYKRQVSTDIAVNSAVVNLERGQNKPPQIESLNTCASMVGRKSRFEITEASNEPLVKLRSQHVTKNVDAFERDSADDRRTSGRHRRSSSLKQDSDFSDIDDIACDKNQYDDCFVDRKRRTDGRKPTKDGSGSRGNNKAGTRGKHKGSLKRDDSSSDDSRRRKTHRDQSRARKSGRHRRSTRSASTSGSDSDSSRNRGSRRQRLRPPKFDGSGSFETFYATFMNCAEYNRWREKDRLVHLKGCLTGEAGQVL